MLQRGSRRYSWSRVVSAIAETQDAEESSVCILSAQQVHKAYRAVETMIRTNSATINSATSHPIVSCCLQSCLGSERSQAIDSPRAQGAFR